MAKKRVVITGMGLVSCFGSDIDHFYNCLLEGKSGAQTIDRFKEFSLPCELAAPVQDFNPDPYMDKRLNRRADPYIRYIMTAGKRALEQAGLAEEGLETLKKDRCGVIVGTAVGGMKTQEEGMIAFNDHGYRRVSPFYCPFLLTNMGSAILAIDLKFTGPNYCISTACATSNYCMVAAYNHIVNDEADLIVTGGSEATLSPLSLAGFIACRAVTKNNEHPTKASRPWDKARDGFLMGEGSGCLVFESLEHAQARGAPILAEVLSGSINCDANHITDPLEDGSRVAACIRSALEKAGVEPDQVDYVNAHATSTPAGDLAEYRGVLSVFGERDSLKMNSTKSMIGHVLGGAGGIEAIATLKAMETGMLHPTINLDDPEDEIKLDLVPHKAKAHEVNIALSNSFGFGGHNSTMVFGKFKP